MTVIEGSDYCYKSYQNGEIWNNVLFFDEQGYSIIKEDKLKKSFKQQLNMIYKEHKVTPKVIQHVEIAYKHRIILEYTDTEMLHLFCDNDQYDESLMIYKHIEEFCSLFCKKNKLTKIILDLDYWRLTYMR